MSFTRVNPGGWSVGAKLTSSQMNQLDIDHANALDKTTAGDTLSGPIAMASTATITASTAGNIIASVAGGIAAGVTGGFKIGAGASMTVQGLISGAAEINVNEYAGIIVNVNGSILLNGGVLSSTSGGGIQSGVDGGFALTGDSGDWPTFGVSGASPRVRELYSPCDAVQGTSPTSVDAAVGSITQYYPVTVSDVVFIEGGFLTEKVANFNTDSGFGYYIPLRQLHNGATLDAAYLSLSPNVAHTHLPGYQPLFGIFRQAYGSTSSPQALLSGSGYFQSAVSLSTYNSGVCYQFGGNLNQNNVVDTGAHAYFLVIIDEGDPSYALPGTYYQAVQILYTNITSLAFP